MKILVENKEAVISPALKQPEAAAVLGVSQRTLEAWRHRGGGPKYIRISSRCIRYRLSDLLDWQQSRERLNTVDVGGCNEYRA